jgi:hypothetical protein
MPQDEYDEAHVLDEWLVELGTDVVYSIFGGAELDALYPRAVRATRFERCLTGYVDEADLARPAVRAARRQDERLVDVAYRAGQLPYRLGSHAQLKHRLAEAFEDATARHGLRADISTAERGVLLGDAWFELLASARCVLGTESGASALDPRGEVRALERSLRAADPGLSFAEFAARMPPGWDDHRFFAISPRHFEAAMVGACQVLVEGAYDGLLEPGVHYLPVRRDLRDVDDACERMRDRALTARLAARARADLVESGRHTYGAFARAVEDTLAELVPSRPAPARRRLAPRIAHAHDRVAVRAPRQVAAWAYGQAARRAPGALRAARAVKERAR